MLNDFLNHRSKGDRRAIVALAVLAVLLIITLLIVDIVRTGDLIEAQKESLNNANQTKTSGGKKDTSKSAVADVSLHDFDPNTVDSTTLVGFGIAPWKVKIFMKYRSKGKRFSTPESILDTYRWEQSDLDILRPYIHIGEEYRSRNVESDRDVSYDNLGKRGFSSLGSENKSQPSGTDSIYRRKYTSAKFKTLTKVDLNTADSATLCSIPGVGDYISAAIVRYRSKLGGYASVSQLRDIKQVSPELLEWFEVKSDADVKKININKDSFQKLNSHPYIGYEQTKDLLMYRRLYATIRDEAQLLQIGVFSKEDVERLRPYLVY